MKAFLAVLLLIFSANVGAFDDCITGSWFDPNNNGEGISIEVLDTQVIAYFYTYQAGVQEWFFFQGPRPANSDALLVAYDSLITSIDPLEVEMTDIGNGTIKVLNDNFLVFSHDFILDLNLPEESPWCLHTNCQREFYYKRLTEPVSCDLESE